MATGVAGAAFIVCLLAFGGRLGAAFFALVVSIGMVYELGGIVFALGDAKEKRGLLLGTTWLVMFMAFWAPWADHELLMACFLGLATYFLFTAGRHQGPDFAQHFRELAYSVFGMVYLVFLPLYFPLLADGPWGVHATLLFLLIVWSGDTGAYFAGRRFGRRKLYEAISPKKTVEGALGGLLASYLIAVVYKVLFFRGLSWSTVAIVPGLVGVTAQIGDLCESFLKRAFDKKDSGSILPGHGGFLDRFDGVVLSLPIMYGCMRIFA